MNFALPLVRCVSACGGTYTSYKGKIASPSYPKSYPLNSECVWILNNSPGNTLKLSFDEFELQQSENCDLDYLEIREDTGSGKLLGVACGTSIETIESSRTLWIKFRSDGDGVARGFVAEYQFLGNSEVGGPYGRITTPLHPLPFRIRDTLTWRVTVDFQNSMRIDIKDLFIETFNSNCLSYLRVSVTSKTANTASSSRFPFFHFVASFFGTPVKFDGN